MRLRHMHCSCHITLQFVWHLYSAQLLKSPAHSAPPPSCSPLRQGLRLTCEGSPASTDEEEVLDAGDWLGEEDEEEEVVSAGDAWEGGNGGRSSANTTVAPESVVRGAGGRDCVCMGKGKGGMVPPSYGAGHKELPHCKRRGRFCCR